MGKRKRPQIDVLTHDEDLQNDALTETIIHTDLTATDHGLSRSGQYYTVPASPPPSNPANSQGGSIAWNTSADCPSLLGDWDPSTELPGDFMDTAYIDTQWTNGDFDKPKRARTAGDNPLLLWIPEIDRYLGELLRLEGRGSRQLNGKCPDCRVARQAYRCDDCTDTRLFCKGCIVQRHSALPFHRPKEWIDGRFKKVSLRDLGLRIQLGHPIGESCTNPAPSFGNGFVVIDIDAIHEISLDFCDCQTSHPPYVQLLRNRLFPATTFEPRTAATFRVLEFFQLLSLMSKVSAFEYYQTVHRRTDNIGVNPPPDRYKTFIRMVREWRHLKMLKRAGRGHDPSGVTGTTEGELTLLCPACPHPGKNLPENWKECPPEDKWRHALFLGIDANFRLKRLNVSNNARDPSLNHGYAYFVHDGPFNEFLNEYNKKIPDDTSTCNNHDAIKSASIRGGKGTAASGVGAVVCSRHDMKLPVSLGDLQKGERYVNMDYFFCSSVHFDSPDVLVVSYDIACQWSRNLFQRISSYPSRLQINQPPENITFAVPKFHLPAHREHCQITYSLNFLPRVGRTDGEAPERGWAALNPVASSTKEMGPGSRRDTLDDMLGDYNWRKIISLFTSILRKAKEAVPLREEHVAGFKAFSAALPPDTVMEWTHAVRKWELDSKMPNPFKSAVHTVSGNAVKLELAREEALASTSKEIPIIHEDITPSLLISQGLELEDQQRRLQIDMKNLGKDATDLQRANIVEDSNRLRRRIDAWIEVQHLYVPSVATLRARADREGGGAPVEPINIQLMLPSHVVGEVDMSQFLLQYEWRLRFAYMHDVLRELRRHLILYRYGHGQSHHTRSLGVISTVQAKINMDLLRYRENRLALCALAGPLAKTGWERELRPLEDKDIRALNATELNETSRTGEGTRTIPWIWRVEYAGIAVVVLSMRVCTFLWYSLNLINNDKALKIEWCKARARAHRWQEECIILQEETARIITFFKWEARRWRQMAEKTISTIYDEGNTHTEGRRAYALQQTDNRDAMRLNCERAWADLGKWFAMGEGDANRAGFVEFEGF
ncbi:hypothetical protein BD779DRAFT_1611227 [Infundibulicybe gibba]|nr:hypothetical protein BD779DRAFT_1611227 [Infundibulicybe gibba]